MQTNPIRPYKEDSPLRTITKIANILVDLDSIAYQTTWYNPYKDVYSVKIEGDDKDGKFATSGKGRTRLYALASGFAEYIERVQNGLLAGKSFTRLFLDSIKEETGCYFFPDERFMTKEEFDALPPGYLDDIFATTWDPDFSEKYFARLKENGYPGCVAVPYYDVKRNQIVYFPHNTTLMLSGSNGMAAGNTVAEGLFQGICELFERYTASQVYFKQLTPPTVPRDYLKKHSPEEYQLIKEIEKDSGYDVVVKDFSAGERYPGLGVIIKNEEKRIYRLNVGAETSFAVCLSRCLTEIHQGIESKETTEKAMLPIPQTEHDYFLNDDEESLIKRNQQFLDFTKNGTGVFPRSLFEDDDSYSFDPTVFTPGDSFENEVKGLIDLMINAGHDIYLRDVSFLGFPSFVIYVPTVSRMGKKTAGTQPKDPHYVTKHDRIEDLFFPFKDCTDENMLELAAILDDASDTSDSRMKDRLKLEFMESSSWYTIPTSFFLTMMWYKLDRITDAVRNLRLFMKTTKNQEDEYFKIVLSFLELKEKGSSEDEIRDALLGGDGSNTELANEVIKNFSNKSKLFNLIDIPACPDCQSCRLYDECLTTRKIDFTKRVNVAMSKNRISQQEQFQVYSREPLSV